jgi:hypothetical protein
VLLYTVGGSGQVDGLQEKHVLNPLVGVPPEQEL